MLAETAPEAVTKALQGPVQEALQHGQDEDRARTCAAAEALSGLLASRTAFEVSPGESMHLSITYTWFTNLSSLSYSTVIHGTVGLLTAKTGAHTAGTQRSMYLVEVSSCSEGMNDALRIRCIFNIPLLRISTAYLQCVLAASSALHYTWGLKGFSHWV